MTTTRWSGTWSVGLIVAGGATLGVDLSTDPLLRLLFVVACWTVLMGLSRKAKQRPVLRAALIAWALIVLLPAGWYLIFGGWRFAGREVPQGLPATLQLHLAALTGIWLAGVMPIPRRRVSLPPGTSLRIRWRQLLAVSIVLCGLTLLAATTFSADGGVLQLDGGYGEGLRGNSGLLATQFIPLSLGVGLLLLAANARGLGAKLGGAEVALLLLIVATDLASGTRVRAFAVLGAWASIRLFGTGKPRRTNPGASALRAYSRILGLAGAFVILIFVANVLVFLRTDGQSARLNPGYLSFEVTSLDVIGSAEFWVEESNPSGQGDGFDLLRAPLHLVPVSLGGLEGADPVVEQSQIVLVGGASAPFWFAFLYDWGIVGMAVGMGLMVAVLEFGYELIRRRTTSANAAAHLERGAPFIVFMVLSRLSPAFVLTSLIFLVFGLWVIPRIMLVRRQSSASRRPTCLIPQTGLDVPSAGARRPLWSQR